MRDAGRVSRGQPTRGTRSATLLAPALVGFWLALKAVRTGVFHGRLRHIYQRFLIGSAASVLFAAVGWRMILWDTHRPEHVYYAKRHG